MNENDKKKRSYMKKKERKVNENEDNSI